METVLIRTESKEYPLYIGKDLTSRLDQLIKKSSKAFTKILIISDETVASLYLDSILSVLSKHFSVIHYIVPAGEKAKSFEIYYECQSFALSNGLDRSSLLLALGGGVVGDLAGFVAATFMRGIPFIQLPTTLLAHDSAVGGKVAINHELGKNMIGAFYQPEAVIYNVAFLQSLPEVELRSGFAEVIKHAMIYDKPFYTWLEREVKALSELKEEKLIYSIKKGIAVKAKVVEQDEQEKGLRAILNFGHTLGHAIEAELGYGKITHGDAIAIGMIFALKVSEQFYDIDLQLNSQTEFFQRYGFPTDIPSRIRDEDLLSRMKTDKKAYAGKIRMVLLKEIGSVKVEEVPDDLILSILKEWRDGRGL